MNRVTSMPKKVGHFAASLGACLAFIYIFLPYLTDSVPMLNRMSQYLDSNGIDPTRYYYTDVAQVKESEDYLETVLK